VRVPWARTGDQLLPMLLLLLHAHPTPIVRIFCRSIFTSSPPPRTFLLFFFFYVFET
jgi:hypothetical protein